MRRYNLDFQIPCFNCWKFEFLIWIFKEADVLCLKFAYRLKFSSRRIIPRKQLKLFQIPAFSLKNQYLECIKDCWPIIFKSVNRPTAENTYVYIPPIFLIAVDGITPLIISSNNDLAAVLWRKQIDYR